MKELTYIIFSAGWDGLPIAHKLAKEGCEVMVGQIESTDEYGTPEKPDEKEMRLKQYEGMLEKMPAKKLIKILKEVDDKDNYFIFFDQNNLWPLAQELLDAGFTKGLFPTEEDFEFEKDREKAMQFVDEAYEGISIIPHKRFSSVNNAISYLKKANNVFVIQSKGDHVGTVVPKTDDVDAEREQMINQLEKNRAAYEKGEIILKIKLPKPVEITPQIVFYNGKPVFTDLDIETKNIGDGENNGNQVGCGSNLVIRTQLEDRINRLAFPRAVYDMAATRTGIFVWDISLYLMGEEIYFGEFCPNRFGYDSLMTEIEMSGSAKEFFGKIMAGENPLDVEFGAGVRLFNLNKQEDREVIIPEDGVWLYEVYGKEDKIMSTGYCWDLGVATGSGDTIDKAVDAVYDVINNISFKELYTKTKHDFLDTFPTSILFRFYETNHRYYDAPDREFVDERLVYQKRVRDTEISYKGKIDSLKKEMMEALDGEE